MAARNRFELAPALGGGLVAGVIAGVALTAIMMTTLAFRGEEVWQAVKGAAAPFLGDRALQPGFDGTVVVMGTLAHLGVSALWGLGFGLLAFGLSRAATLLAGAAWGLVVWVGMFYVVLPALGLGAMVDEVPVAYAIFEHVLFGFLVGLAFLPFQRRHEVEERAPIRPRRWQAG
jgi:uncharacterized membrane protein YagU involved in acid resistance